MSGPHRILLVDDDQDLRSVLVLQLRLHEEFVTSEAGTAAEGLAAVADAHHDLILLDVGLPDMDGRELCRLMRKHGVKAPVIMLTAQNSDSDTILGLDAGANDYVAKPFKVAILLARIRAQLRQHEQNDDAVFTIGPYSFRPSAKMLFDEARNRKIHLTERETAILKYLYRGGDRIVRRETLLNEIWGYGTGIETHTLETHIYRLRQKIEPEAEPTLLLTEAGGYRLNR